MGGKGFVSAQMLAGRVSAHKKLTAEMLTGGFSLENKQHFALFIWPKTGGAAENDKAAVVECKTYQGDSVEDCPHTCFAWGEPAIIEIADGGIDLDVYDVWIGAGADIPDDDE